MASASQSTRSSRQDTSSSATSPARTLSDAGIFGGNLLDEGSSQYRSARDPPIVEKPQTRAHVRPVVVSPSIERGAGSSRFVLSIDYGTTFTGVAFSDTQSNVAELSKIEVIQNWGQLGNHLKIPSVYSYSPAPNGEEQWGSDISPDAITMVNTKLELELQDKRIDELNLTLQVLEGTRGLSFDYVKKSGGYPEYSWKTPAEIIRDYLTRLFERVYETVDLSDPARSKMPVDIVVTVPVNWSYEATNATLRSLMQAGFNHDSFRNLNEMILVTEPEAAAYYTARRLREDQRTDFLKRDECFILCDAGGGTVDVIAYQVTKLEPHLELKRITLPTSDKCGAAYINVHFKRWLHKTIGDQSYLALDPRSKGQRIDSHTTEGGKMRKVIEKFDMCKKAFSNSTDTSTLVLPEPLHMLDIPDKVHEGEVTIQFEEMKTMFGPCVNRVIELIEAQRQQIESQGRRVKNVFLVGGFGESPYLQEELQKSLKLRKIAMRRPNARQSWTAVVQGGVIYGIEKTRHQRLKLMFTSPKSYSIVINEAVSLHMFDRQDLYTDLLTNSVMARKQLVWMIRKGDLILSDGNKAVEKEFTFTFRATDSRQFELPVYVYPDDDDDVPDRWETGQHEIRQIGVVKCDFSTLPIQGFEQRRNNTTGERYHIAYLMCTMQNSLTHLDVEVWANKTSIGHKRLSTENTSSRRSSVSSDSLYS